MNARDPNPLLGAAAKTFLASKHQALIGGSWVDAKSGETLETFDPGTGRVIARVPACEAPDVDEAVKAARAAFESGPWPKMSGSDRAKLMWKLAELIEHHSEELAQLESLNNGKPLAYALDSDLKRSVEVFRYTAGWATKLNGETMQLSQPGEFHAFTLREPVGVVAGIIPWNSPLMMAAWKIAPAIATGCTIILKPAEQTPLTALRLGQLIQEAGFPDGVVNIIPGYGHTAGAAIAAHHGIDKVAFTGSGEVGRLVLQAAAGNLKKVSFELGGKSPAIVFPDADLSLAVPGVARAIFTNSGQVCSAGSRLYAHQKIFDRVIEGVAAEAKKIRVGHGLEAGTQMGPLVSREQLNRVTGYVDSGRRDGATVVTGGKRLEAEGYFMAPTVLTNTRQDMTVVQEEIFGPVLCASSFSDDDLDRVAKEANSTIYGLAGSIWTRDLRVAHKMVRRIRAGMIGVNVHQFLDPAVPFGGFKQSGWGREKGREQLDLYTEVKSVVMAL